MLFIGGDDYISNPEIKRVTPNNYFTRTASEKEANGNKDRNAYVVIVSYITVYVDVTTGEVIGGGR